MASSDGIDELITGIVGVDTLFQDYQGLIIQQQQGLERAVKMANQYRQTIMKAVEYTTDPEMKVVLGEAFRPIE